MDTMPVALAGRILLPGGAEREGVWPARPGRPRWGEVAEAMGEDLRAWVKLGCVSRKK
mgnify:CR=1 FL=1